jgi:hypothetical protein
MSKGIGKGNGKANGRSGVVCHCRKDPIEVAKEMELFFKDISSSKKRSLKFLVDAGICTKNGNLTAFYR